MGSPHHARDVGARRAHGDPGGSGGDQTAKQGAAAPGSGQQFSGIQSTARPLIRLSVAEICHLLGTPVVVMDQTAAEILAWSRWCRHHQAQAKFYHDKRRGALLDLQL